MSFYCEHCHFKNNEVQPAGEMQEQGSRYTFHVSERDDLERQIVKSDTAMMKIEDLDIEIPAGRGRFTNVEGVVREVSKDLEAGQAERQKSDPEVFEKIQAIVNDLGDLVEKANFTVSLDDPAGNSWIEPLPKGSEPKEKYSHQKYARSAEQNLALGLPVAKEEREPGNGAIDTGQEVGLEEVDIIEGQTYELPVHCPGCASPAQMRLQMVNIPYFKQVVLSTTDCQACGYHTTDVKTGGEIPEKGKRIWLEVKTAEDLRRDILKSESCLLKIPECKIEVVPGTMGGRFTTVEGLLAQIRDDLKGSIFDMDAEDVPDSMPAEKKKAWGEFFAQMDRAVKAEMPYTVLLEDPLGSSYCQSFGEPGQDPQIREEDYERTAEEEQELGLADMKTHLNEEGEYVAEPRAYTKDQTQDGEAELDEEKS